MEFEFPETRAGNVSIVHFHGFISIIGYCHDIITLLFVSMLFYYNRFLHGPRKRGIETLNFLASRQTWIGSLVLFPPCLPGKGTKCDAVKCIAS